MAKDKISDYSSTANSNTDIAGINIDEGCAPSGINDAIRTLMAQLKNFQTGTGGDSFNGPFAGTTIAATDTTDASSTTAAAMKTAGGLAVAKKAYIGLDANIYGLTVGRGAGSVSTNTAVGASALVVNTTGDKQVAVGTNALWSNTTGVNNTAVGRETMYRSVSGGNNTAVGINALHENTTANSNTAIGADSLFSNTTGGANTAVGRDALTANTTASNNAAFGRSALLANTTGEANVAMGTEALKANTTASNNTAVGYQAGYSNTTGTYSTYIGWAAGYSTTGAQNTFIGQGAGYYVTSGAKNTILGGYSGNQGGLDIRTSSNYVVLSDGDGNPRFYHSSGQAVITPNVQVNNRAYGFDNDQLYPYPDNTLRLGNASYRWTTVYATTGTINTSDVNTKQDITALDDAEKRVAVAIKSLIKKYRFKDAVAEKGDAARIHIGAIAQEVQAAFVAEGLDPARYALFCSDTWYEVDGQARGQEGFYTAETEGAVEVTRLGLRYEELLAFVIAAL
jgi:hypothetical protein